MPNPSCGPFSQTLFLGASITSFTSSLGWNGDQGRLIVELVEDPCGGNKVYYDAQGLPQITHQPDFFNPPKVGSPVYFQFGNFTFGGILQNWEQQTDVRNGKTYSVQVTDASEILEGCQVIINNYTGSTFGIPNLINAFGFNEELFSSCNTLAYTGSLNPPLDYTPAAGFGGSNVSEDGMSWFQIRDALSALVNSPSTNYGGQLQLRDSRYFLDISELPYLDSNFRFNGDSTTIMEAISQVCAAAGADYFTELLFFAPNYIPAGYGGISGLIHPDVLKIIKVRLVGRLIQKTAAYNVDLTVGSQIDTRLNLGKISQFLGDGSGKERSARGLELRNDVTNSFLVGDNRQDLWMQAYTGSYNTYTDTIWPYWGKDNLGFPIISNNINDDHTFVISTLGMGADLISVLGSTYTIKMIELRAALAGMEEWSLYMWNNKPTIAEGLDVDSSFTIDDIGTAVAANKAVHPNDLKRTRVSASKIAYKHAGADPDNENLDQGELQKKLFDIVHSYAELAGKKFMVALPLICSASDSAAPFSVKLNWQVSDGGWTDSNVQLSPLATPLTPDSPILELFRQDDGRISCFVYFNTNDATKLIDYSNISPDDVVPISPTECYVKATLEEITFLNPIAQTYPRAIVSLNSVVTIKAAKVQESDAKIVDALLGWLAEAPREWLDIKAGLFGDDTNKLSLFPMPSIPQGAAVPLRSTNLSYGPWITSLNFGPAAKTVYERDTSISPWAFGSSSIMNYAGQIKVETQVTQQIVNEAGSMTIPGSPPGRLGQILLAGGPEITKIDVNMGIGGITTSLQLRTWVPNFGELGRRRIQNLRTAGTYQQKLQRAFIKNNSARTPVGRLSNWVRELNKSDRFNRHSSHTLIAGEYIEDYQNANYKRTNVVFTDVRKILPEIYNGYENKAFMDLGGLFRPFETSGVPGHNLPAFSGIIPSTSNQVTSLSLNPFKISEKYNGTSIGHDMEIIARGPNITGLTDISIYKSSGVYESDVFRGLGLRAPLVLVGWGFDTNGKPVPNKTPGNPGTQFADNYLRKPETWKAGPVDVRWDESRGVWSAAGSVFRLAKLHQNLTPGRGADAQLCNVTIVSGVGIGTQGYRVDIVLESGGYTRVFDGLRNYFDNSISPNFPATPSGAIIYVQKEQTTNEWFMFAASVW